MDPKDKLLHHQGVITESLEIEGVGLKAKLLNSYSSKYCLCL